MSKVVLSSALMKASGKMGNVVFKKYHDEVVMSHVPDMSGHKPTAGQLSHRERFKLAVLYGKTVLADPVKKAVYEATARQKGISAFALTVADFLNGPVVDQIDISGYSGKVGETIRITAHDDFEVSGVAVAIHDANGAVLEQGAATNRYRAKHLYLHRHHGIAARPTSLHRSQRHRPPRAQDDQSGGTHVIAESFRFRVQRDSDFGVQFKT